MAQKFTVPITVKQLASAGSDAVTVYVDQDTFSRLKVEAGGRLTWGSGASAGDVNLYRASADVLQTDDTFKTPVLYVNNIEINTTGATTDQVLKFNGTKFVPGTGGGGGSTVTASTTPPASPSTGSIWFDSNTAKTYVYYDSFWVEIGGTSGGAKMYVSQTAPSSPLEGQLWFKSDTAQTFAYYDSFWVEVGAAGMSAIASDVAPASPVSGQLWFNSSTGGTYVYYDSYWIEIGAVAANTIFNIVDAKGDILLGTADNTLARQAVGTNGQLLQANSATTTGVQWITPTYAPLADPTFTGTVTIPTGASITLPSINNFVLGYTTTATAGGTTTLTNTSNNQQVFTGTLTQTVVMPVASTMGLGTRYVIENNSTGTVTVNSSGSNLIITIPSGMSVKVTCILTSGTTAASWDAEYVGFNSITGTGSSVLSVSPTFTGTVTLPSTTSIGSVTGTEIGYSSGVTSAIQTQLNTKAPTVSPVITGGIIEDFTHGVNSRLRLLAGNNGAGTGEANLVFWVSEPAATWTGTGIARNRTNSSGSFPRINTGLSAQMIRFDEGGSITFYMMNSAGTVENTITFDTAGAAYKPGGGSWSAPSDIRLKDNIRDYEKGTAELMQVRVREWEHNGKGGIQEGSKGLGVVADEIELVLPETVHTYEGKLNPDDEETTDIKSVNPTEITWLMVKTIQEQQATIQALTARIEALEA